MRPIPPQLIRCRTYGGAEEVCSTTAAGEQLRSAGGQRGLRSLYHTTIPLPYALIIPLMCLAGSMRITPDGLAFVIANCQLSLAVDILVDSSLVRP